MTLLDRLRAIDEQHVPRLAAGLRAAGDRVARARPPGTARLARLDERYASRGLLGQVRRTPASGVGVLAVLLLTGALAVADRAGDPPAVVPAGPRTALGPAAGDDVEDYLAIASARLDAAAREPVPATALVSLDPALPAAQAQALAAGLEVDRAYARAPELQVVDAAGLQRLAAAPAGPDGCPCVVALLVTGPGTVLGPLAGQEGVRAVEATAAAAPDVAVRLLLPGVQGTVSEPVVVPGEGGQR